MTRTSWALNPTSRTLMAQVELPNPKGTFLPGMYAYGSVLIERPSVRALPVSAVTQIGNQTYCYLVLKGKAARTAVQTGVTDGTWVEVGEARPVGRIVGRDLEAVRRLRGGHCRRPVATRRRRPRGGRSRPGRDQGRERAPAPKTVVQPTPAWPRWRAAPELTVPRAAVACPAREVHWTSTFLSVKKMASSAESVGAFRLGKVAEIV